MMNEEGTFVGAREEGGRAWEKAAVWGGKGEAEA
jgi:hypothetical protein